MEIHDRKYQQQKKSLHVRNSFQDSRVLFITALKFMYCMAEELISKMKKQQNMGKNAIAVRYSCMEEMYIYIAIYIHFTLKMTPKK